MNLEIQLLNHPDCTPIKDAVVEIWHCDAHGTYGGYPEVGHDPWEFIKLLEFGKLPHPEPTTNEMFLRGAQLSDENGMIKFTTILPCWYETRMPHIHMKIIKNEKEWLTSELLFEEKFYNKVFTSVDPHTQHGKSPYNPSNDKNLPNFNGSTGMVLKTKCDGKEIANSFGKIGIKLS